MFENQPLAERMRPQTLDDYVGQEHLIGPNGVIRKAIQAGRIPSMILWGPPGVGKTTLAKIIGQTLERPFLMLSAINAGVKDVREIIDEAKKKKFFNSPNPVLFIDEIHRFSKAQQDSLLGAVEQGVVTLIGATTENPSFEVIPALLSRCQVYVLESLGADTLRGMIAKALQQDEVLKRFEVEIVEDAALLRASGSDGRKLYNALELVVSAADSTTVRITDEFVLQVLQQNLARYDKSGEQHYDIISAFIKSVRGSDPNAALYWLARMLEGGEDVKFIARRLIILSVEDIGLANPNALLMANQCFEAVHKIGMPEARIILSQTTIYLATSPKSNSAYEAIDAAIALVKQTGDLPVPMHLRNSPTKLMKEIGYGKNYQYAHAHEGNFVEQEFLPDAIKGTALFKPGKNPQEQTILERLLRWWKNKYYGAKS
jgi:putative ATPase